MNALNIRFLGDSSVGKTSLLITSDQEVLLEEYVPVSHEIPLKDYEIEDTTYRVSC